MSRLWTVIREELAGLHLRLLLARLVLWPLPLHVGSRVRVYILRLAGFDIGPGTLMWGTPTITGDRGLVRRLHIGAHCWLNAGVWFNAGAEIIIGDRVAIGQQAMILTQTHDLDSAARRAGALRAAPVRIGAGAWLGARCLLLPGVTVGEGAVVAAGAVVAHDVAPHTMVGGVPARVLRELSPGADLGRGFDAGPGGALPVATDTASGRPDVPAA